MTYLRIYELMLPHYYQSLYKEFKKQNVGECRVNPFPRSVLMLICFISIMERNRAEAELGFDLVHLPLCPAW